MKSTERLGDGADRPVAAHQHAERDRHHRRQQERDPHPGHADRDVAEIVRACEQSDPGGEHSLGRRQELGMHQTQGGDRHPSQKHDAEGAGPDPQLDPVIGPCSERKQIAPRSGRPRQRPVMHPTALGSHGRVLDCLVQLVDHRAVNMILRQQLGVGGAKLEVEVHGLVGTPRRHALPCPSCRSARLLQPGECSGSWALSP